MSILGLTKVNELVGQPQTNTISRESAIQKFSINSAEDLKEKSNSSLYRFDGEEYIALNAFIASIF